jgi:folate-dependent phosphoribosylglycinamide formyltransferase PurN
VPPQPAPGNNRRLTTGDLVRPIRVVVFGGAFFEPAALEFLALLDEHPEVEFAGGFSQSRGFGLLARVMDVIQRRRLLAPAVLCLDAARAALQFAIRPRAQLDLRRRIRRALAQITAVPDIHASEVLNQVRSLRPDLGLLYGAPILRSELFEIPAFGTLGIHHGRLPDYRGKKTTFWAMHNATRRQESRFTGSNAGLDTGDVVCTGEVPTAGRTYGRVAADVQQLGLKLYMAAIVATKRGEASWQPQSGRLSPLYRQPGARDLIRLWRRQFLAGSKNPAKR